MFSFVLVDSSSPHYLDDVVRPVSRLGRRGSMKGFFSKVRRSMGSERER